MIDMGRVRNIVDRNGNNTRLTFCKDSGAACQSEADTEVDTIVDPIGRTTTINHDSCGTNCDRISYKGFNGASRDIEVKWGAPQSNRRPDLAAATNLFPELTGTPLLQTGDSVLSVKLPDQVSAYSFFYNPYGEIARVVLPTGGAIDFDYGQGFTQLISGVYASGQVLDRLDGLVNAGSTTPLFNPYIYRRLLKRREFLSVPPTGTATEGLDCLASKVTIYRGSEQPTTFTKHSDTQ